MQRVDSWNKMLPYVVFVICLLLIAALSKINNQLKTIFEILCLSL